MVASARQIEAAREHVSCVRPTITRVPLAVRRACVITVPVVGPPPCLMAVVFALAAFVVLVDARRAWCAPERQRVIVVIAIALVPVARLAWIACVTIVARIEIEHLTTPVAWFIVLATRGGDTSATTPAAEIDYAR